MTVGLMQGTTGAIARELDNSAGFALTRLTAPVAKGDVVWPVESTLDFPASGSVVARGTLYTYASKTSVTLEGIQFTDGVTTFNGAKIDIPTESSITDFSRARTGMDLLRRAILVEFAEGNDLDTLGRNLGVVRLRGVASDAVYREIIKALAYNPKGTVFGIETLLNALLGVGNFAIFEDLVSQPNKIFVELLGAAITSTESAGKAFFHPRVFRPADSGTQVTIDGAPPIETVYSVTFKDENHTSDFRNQLPSAETLVEFPGDPGTTLWAYIGTNETNDVTQVSGSFIEISDTSITNVAQYRHTARVQPTSIASLSMLQTPTSTATIANGASDGLQWGAIMQDTVRTFGWGIIRDNGNYNLGLINPSTGAFVSGAAVIGQPVDTFIEVNLRKVRQDRIELYVDGTLVQTEPYSTFPGSANTRMSFGANSTTLSGMIGRVKQVGFFSTTPVDFWASRGTNGQAFPATTTDKTFEDLTEALFVAGDVGKRFIITGSTASNPQNGNNNGLFEIDTFISSSRVTLKGEARTGASVAVATPTVFRANDINAFQFPDDLGKEIVISGATNPANNGTFVITDLLSEADGVTSLQSFSTILRERTGIAVAASASFVTESGLSWRLDPVFVNETLLDWELSDTGTESGGVLTLRQALPGLEVTRILEIAYTDVLSAQLLRDASVAATLVSVGPPRLYTFFGFYLADPLGVVRRYLDIITVAGVIPELLER